MFVSTKQPVSQEADDFTETDAFVAKLNTTATDTAWTFIYTAETTKTHRDNDGSDAGFTNQECLYAIVPAPGGGYVISGNNSSNFDDDYVVKFKDATSQTVSNTTVDHEHIYYYGPDDLTIGPSFTVESTAYVELVATNSITINGPFEAKLGSEFEAEIDSDFGIQSVRPGPESLAPLFEPEPTAGEDDVETPEVYTLSANYPNPFNPATSIRFTLPEATDVSLVIYDVTGREVARLLDRPLAAGTHRVIFDATGLPSGVYLYRLQAGTFVKTHRMTLIK